ncbi:transcriptional regulator, partial [Escherichia coli]|nr:transcriptional regulator [Escherichia coli]
LINVNFFSSDRTSFCECNRFPYILLPS